MRHKHTANGSVLVFSLITITLLLITGIAVMSVAVVEKKSAFATQKSVIAFQAADSAAERIIKRIYVHDSPPIGFPPLNPTSAEFTDATLNDLATQVGEQNALDVACNDGVITGKNDPSNTFPDYAFTITFYDNQSPDPQPLSACNEYDWRDKITKLTSIGFYRNTSRRIEIGIRPREE